MSGEDSVLGQLKAAGVSEIDNNAVVLSDKPTQFKPTELMVALLNTYTSQDFRMGLRDACLQTCSVGNGCAKGYGVEALRVQWYKWRDNMPGFREWWTAEADKHFTSSLPRVHGAMLKAAVADDGTAADRKLMLERFDAGYHPAGGLEQAQSPDVAVQVLDRVIGLLDAAAVAAGVVLAVDPELRRRCLPAAGPRAEVIDAEAEEVGAEGAEQAQDVPTEAQVGAYGPVEPYRVLTPESRQRQQAGNIASSRTAKDRAAAREAAAATLSLTEAEQEAADHAAWLAGEYGHKRRTKGGQEAET